MAATDGGRASKPGQCPTIVFLSVSLYLFHGCVVMYLANSYWAGQYYFLC